MPRNPDPQTRNVPIEHIPQETRIDEEIRMANGSTYRTTTLRVLPTQNRELGKDELRVLLPIPEPQRCSKWMSTMFTAEEDGSCLTHAGIFELYESNFTLYKDKYPLLLAEDVIATLESVFPHVKPSPSPSGVLQDTSPAVRGLSRRITTSTLTAHLLSITTTPSYVRATKSHPFLLAAAAGTLPFERLAFWLAQDRIYAAHAYPRFIGALLAAYTPQLRVLQMLSYALTNIVREVTFFDDTATRWGLNIDVWQERKGTRDYTAEMARVGGTGRIAEGLVFLWAMEKVYLDAWTNVQVGLEVAGKKEGPLVALADNWSSKEFKGFVDDLAVLVDDIYEGLGPSAWTTATDIWRRIVELEESFWPEEGEEALSKR